MVSLCIALVLVEINFKHTESLRKEHFQRQGLYYDFFIDNLINI